jgi:hypothetical protein
MSRGVVVAGEVIPGHSVVDDVVDLHGVSPPVAGQGFAERFSVFVSFLTGMAES